MIKYSHFRFLISRHISPSMDEELDGYFLSLFWSAAPQIHIVGGVSAFVTRSLFIQSDCDRFPLYAGANDKCCLLCLSTEHTKCCKHHKKILKEDGGKSFKTHVSLFFFLIIIITREFERVVYDGKKMISSSALLIPSLKNIRVLGWRRLWANGVGI